MAYQKQTFKDNETVLKAEHLNHIEDGIVALENTMNDSKGVSIPNGAKVGQIIQVSKVDGSGKPTEWKAVDHYNKAEIDAIMGAYITDIDTLVGGDA